MTPETALQAVLDGAAALFEREPRDGARAAVAALKAARLEDYRVCAGAAEPGDLLDQAADLPGALPIVAEICDARSVFQWDLWTGAGLDEGTSQSLCFMELLGPDGHFPARDVRVGLLISAPHTDYPLSAHSGEETYVVLSGRAEFVLDNGPYSEQPPGAMIHHPAWAPHGRRTGDEPFLGLWRWSGDLDLDTFKLADDGRA